MLEVAFGLLFAIGALSQAVSTLPNSEQFYQDMADLAWLPPAKAFVEAWLVPNSNLATILVVVFQAATAIGILSRGSLVRPALVGGGLFSIVGAVTGSPAETIGYGALAALLFWLAHERHVHPPTAIGAVEGKGE
ncbi:MAG: hypothetical protein ACR2N7_00795 [Acidimicrobiia bacterium]